MAGTITLRISDDNQLDGIDFDLERDESVLDGLIMGRPEITYNRERTYKSGKKAPDGIELRFNGTRPTEELRERLKAHGFRFSEKQTMWYAVENEKSSELTKELAAHDIELDDTTYEKVQFWALVRSQEEYRKLRNYTEFMLPNSTPKFFNTKKQLESRFGGAIYKLIASKGLRFKKFYSKPIGEDVSDDPSPSASSEPSNSANTEDYEEKGQKLLERADSMDAEIEKKMNPATASLPSTARRRGIIERMRADGRRLIEIQKTLRALGNAWTDRSIDEYPELKGIRYKAEAGYFVGDLSTITDEPESDNAKSRFDYGKKTLSRMGIDSIGKWVKAIKSLQQLTSHIPAPPQLDEVALKIRELENKIQGMKIPGFFPTPPDLIKEMINLAEIKAQDLVLDPSAGKGDILDAVRENFGDSISNYAVEIQHSLREILILKDYQVLGNDFMEFQPSPMFDRILMNPPFEKGQDADHVMRAYGMLAEGGKLVAVVSEGLFFRKNKKETAFRKFLDTQGAYVSQPVKGAFKSAFNRTGVNVRIIALDAIEAESEDDFAIIEAEAEAELELLKMRVEASKRSAGVLSGLSQKTDNDKLSILRQKAAKFQQSQDLLDFR